MDASSIQASCANTIFAARSDRHSTRRTSRRSAAASPASLANESGGRPRYLGYDGRLSSPELEAALVAGLTGSGANVVRIGRGPTPMLYYATHALNTDAGVMVTGSHNPPDQNGLKMVLKGDSFFGADIQTLGKRVEAGDFHSGAGSVRDQSVMERYVDRLAQDGRPGK
ncbi:MAG TPA: phosphomannomutase/phosphoglucomutase, partial [Burkholderiales bacterium]|nr:phosphomannomutase/phosphoglucomutase [Burkholderiales bacterium]